jgi:pSer/pThr/pTyr-binding forkhead associated (FHA) protein
MSCPLLVYVDAAGCRRDFALSERAVVTLGRRIEADVCLPWDPGVSRLHAELIHRAGEWVIADDGLSQNGTLVNGLPLEGRRRLHDGDLITVGSTTLTFCAAPDDGEQGPLRADADVTLSVPEMRPSWTYSEQQRHVLRALCRPLFEDGEGVEPASDGEIATRTGIDERVVSHELDDVAQRFGFGGLREDERRLRTALAALRSGLIDASE